MLFKPFTKGSGWFTYILIITLHPITLVSVNDATFLSDEISVFWCHQEVFDGFASFEEYLNAILLTSVFNTFTQAFNIWNSYVCSSFMGLVLPLSPLFLLLDCLCTMVFFCALFKAHFGYLHAVRACLMWSCSFSRCSLVEQTSFALWNKVLMTLYFAAMAWWLSHWR